MTLRYLPSAGSMNRLGGVSLSRAKLVLERFGIRAERAKHGLNLQRAAILRALGVDLVIDVGAAEGQYVDTLRRRSSYFGNILSFEPRIEGFERLNSSASRDHNWTCLPFAVGDEPGTRNLMITSWAHSSSLSEPLAGVGPAAVFATVETRAVEVRRLDDCNEALQGQVIHLKIDVQGNELSVLRSATGIMDKVASVEAELSLTELYKNQDLIEDVVSFLRGIGFRPIALERGYCDAETGYFLQVDGLFLRRQ